MLEITNIRNGAVLDCHCGTETADYLEIEVQGLASPQSVVMVNGAAADRCDRNFSARVRLTGKFNTITVESSDNYGTRTQSICVVWDKASFKRYNFFFDDCIFALRYLAQERPASIFDEPQFLGRLKTIHDRYNSKFTLNLFFSDDHHKDFTLADMPDIYKKEFENNADWLRFSFHAYSEFPDRPYQNASGEKLAADFDLIYAQVCRFAGPQSFIAPMVIHWGMTNPENFAVLKARGVNCLAGAFVGAKTSLDESHSMQVTDIGYHYEKDIALYIKSRNRFYDRFLDIFLLDNLTCCNYDDSETLGRKFAGLQSSSRDTINLMSHEQYSFKDYFNYIPDHLDRVETACRLASENGYEPVWFNDGILGNTAW